MKLVKSSLIGFILLLIIAIFLMPLAVVWSLNTLFSLNIAYSWQTWLAIIIIGVYFKQTVLYDKNK